MPLDTMPLSKPRKLIAFALLLAFLGGSLALAQFIVTTHKGPAYSVGHTSSGDATFKVVVPKNFVAESRAASGDDILWNVTTPDGNRRMARIDFPPSDFEDLTPIEKRNTIRERVFDLLEIGHDLDGRRLRPIVFGGVDADLFIGADSQKKTRAYVVAVGVNDHYLVLVYSGDKESAVSPTPPLTEADEAVILDICRKSRLVIDGVERVPQTAPTTR